MRPARDGATTPTPTPTPTCHLVVHCLGVHKVVRPPPAVLHQVLIAPAAAGRRPSAAGSYPIDSTGRGPPETPPAAPRGVPLWPPPPPSAPPPGPFVGVWLRRAPPSAAVSAHPPPRGGGDGRGAPPPPPPRGQLAATRFLLPAAAADIGAVAPVASRRAHTPAHVQAARVCVRGWSPALHAVAFTSTTKASARFDCRGRPRLRAPASDRRVAIGRRAPSRGTSLAVTPKLRTPPPVTPGTNLAA